MSITEGSAYSFREMSCQQRAEMLRMCGDLRGRAETAEAFQASLQVHVDSLRADLQKVGAENDEFRQRWSKKAHELHLAKQRIAELEMQVERLQSVAIMNAAELKLLTAKKLPEPTGARKAQDAAVGRITRR